MWCSLNWPHLWSHRNFGFDHHRHNGSDNDRVAKLWSELGNKKEEVARILFSRQCPWTCPCKEMKRIYDVQTGLFLHRMPFSIFCDKSAALSMSPSLFQSCTWFNWWLSSFPHWLVQSSPILLGTENINVMEALSYGTHWLIQYQLLSYPWCSWG